MLLLLFCIVWFKIKFHIDLNLYSKLVWKTSLEKEKGFFLLSLESGPSSPAPARFPRSLGFGPAVVGRPSQAVAQQAKPRSRPCSPSLAVTDGVAPLVRRIFHLSRPNQDSVPS